ncbi:MAG: 30S ribosomal protein S6e [Candidatus Micrarchaeota archaeon]
MKLVVSDTKTGKSYQKDMTPEQESTVIGKKLGEEIDGGMFGAAGYKFKLSGGSDTSGFPMRKDVGGATKRQILLTKGVGFHTKRNGERRRKMVHGNTYSSDMMQINCVVTAAGTAPLDQLFPKQEKKS